jgi:hypothetical protein
MWPWLSAVADFFGRFQSVDLIFLGAVLIFWLWILHRNQEEDDTYDLADNIKDPYTHRANPTMLVYVSLAALSVWWAVRTTVNGGDASSFIVTVLGIFVAKGGVDHAISAWGDRAPDKSVAPQGEPPAVEIKPADQPQAVQAVPPAPALKGKGK